MATSGPHEREMANLRSRNTAAGITVLRELGSATLSQLAGATGLSRPTLESILGDLAAEGLVIDGDARTPSGSGRPARRFVFASEAAHVIGVDLGLNSIAAAASDLSGRIVAAIELPVDGAADGFDRLQLVTRVVDELRGTPVLRGARIAAVAVAVSGIVDDRGRMLLADLVPDWNGVDLRAHLERALSVPVAIANDVKLAAVAEHHAGAARIYDDVVYLKVDRYISAAVILDGRLHLGRNFAAGEIGVLESLGFERVLPPDPVLPEERRALLERATAGDAEAEALLDAYTLHVAKSIAIMGLAIDPAVVVVGGGVSELGEPLLARLRAQFASIAGRKLIPELALSALGRRGVLLGAVVRALESASIEVYGNEDVAAPALSIANADGALSLYDQLAGLIGAGEPAPPRSAELEVLG